MPNNFWIPDSILSVGGSIEGFTIPKVNGINLYSFLENKDIKPKDKLFKENRRDVKSIKLY